MEVSQSDSPFAAFNYGELAPPIRRGLGRQRERNEYARGRFEPVPRAGLVGLNWSQAIVAVPFDFGDGSVVAGDPSNVQALQPR
jgi:hypothetical protein